MAINKKVIVSDNVVTFTMGVKKDSFAKVQHVIKVTVNVEGVSRETMLQNNFAGSSMRVKLQNGFMRKQTEGTLAAMAINGYKTTWKDIDSGFDMDPIDALMLLDKPTFIGKMVKDLGLSEGQAEEIYNRKHGIKNEQ